MPKRIGLVYEDEQIRIVFEAVARRILGEDTEFQSLLGGSWPGIKGDVPSLLSTLNVFHIGLPMEAVFVVVDANGEGAHSREQRLADKVGALRYRFGDPNFFAITRQSETLLLGDPQAVNAAASATIPAYANPEGLIDAKRYLIQHLNNAGREFDRNFFRRAALNLNLDRLQANCPQFCRLFDLLQAHL